MARKNRNRRGNKTTDSYNNIPARVGMQTQTQHAASQYLPNFTSRNRMEIEWAYRSSWIIGSAVDSIADDMTRKGIRITSEMEPKARGVIESQFDALEIWDKLNDVIKWSRLYGGAVGYIMIEGQDPSTPLRLETIGEGSFRGILPLDRWQVNPNLEERITELGPHFTMPKYYDLVTTGTGLQGWKIHHTRLIRFDGISLPYQQKLTENEWGMSVVERIWDRLTAFDSSTLGAAQLIYKAHLRTMKVKGYRQLQAMGGPAFDGFLKQMESIRQWQSNEGLTIIDADDEFDTHQYSFGGLNDVLSQFAEQISGAVGIPLVRLFGQSPQGFSTGESDLANYYDNIGSQQERRMRNPLRKLMDIMSRSALGAPLADDFTFEFSPLWQMSDVDRSTVALNTVNAISAAVDSGLMTQKAGATDLREMSDVTGVGASITDEDIINADDEPPPSISARAQQEPEHSGGNPVQNKPTQDSESGWRHRKRFLRWF